MKRWMTIIFTGAILFLPLANAAIANEKHDASLQSIIAEIRQEQNLGKNDPIECTKVAPEKLEKVGEAVMAYMHPDPKEHELMDTMMGGEGSPMNVYMHRMMGARYLGCYAGERGMMGHGMTGYGMLGPSMMGMMPGEETGPENWNTERGRWNMMHMGYGGWLGHWFMGPFIWLLVLAIIGLVVYYAVKAAKGGTQEGSGGKDALAILKERYARGELTKDQFDKMKEDLK